MSDARTESALSSQRLASIDAYRGLVMFLMMAEVLHLSRLASSNPDCGLWKFLAFHQTHVPWVGCSLHDLIQPGFSFLVGVALPFSIASRLKRGQSRSLMTTHALWRAFLLVMLGVFLRSVGHPQTSWTFEDTLSQIGLGYPILFLLGFQKPRVQWAALGTILVGYWAVWALYPIPGQGFDYAAVGASAEWEHNATGFAAHWNKHTNAGAAFDRFFMNLFPRAEPFVANGGGYLTLSFIPTLGTMILGLVAGGWLKRELSARKRLQAMALAGIAGLLLGALLGATGICPVVKRIWTPSWVLFSGGWCFLFMATFYAITDVWGAKRWAFPLVVIGMNSITAYCIAHLIGGFIAGSVRTHLGQDVFKFLGEAPEPFVSGAVILVGYWLILLWMYRRRIFLRI